MNQFYDLTYFYAAQKDSMKFEEQIFTVFHGYTKKQPFKQKLPLKDKCALKFLGNYKRKQQFCTQKLNVALEKALADTGPDHYNVLEVITIVGGQNLEPYLICRTDKDTFSTTGYDLEFQGHSNTEIRMSDCKREVECHKGRNKGHCLIVHHVILFF